MDAQIATLLSRLEATTARLEAVEKQLKAGVIAAPAGAAPAAQSQSSSDDAVSPAQKGFDEVVENFFKPLLPMAEKISPILTQQMKDFLAAIEGESKLIAIASKSKKPAATDLPKLLQPVSDKMGAIAQYKDKNGRDVNFNNIAALAEGVQVLGWVAIEPTPGPFIGEMIPGAEFYTNRVLVAHKGKDQNQCDWAKGLIVFFKELQAYVKKTHTTGLAWNPRGGDALSASASTPAAAPKAAPAASSVAVATAVSAKPTMNLFAELNKGEGLTKGLSHVRDEQKNKNLTPEEKAKLALQVQPKEPKEPAAPKTFGAAKPKLPAKLELNGNKWVCENYVNTNDLTIEGDKSQTVYVSGLQRSTLVIKGKINCMTIDSCVKTAIVMEDAVAVIEVINSRDQKLQISGKAPAINIDKCDGCIVYLSPQCLAEPAIEFYTSKSSSVCISIPGKSMEEDPTELPIPEQFVTHIVNGKLETKQAGHI